MELDEIEVLGEEFLGADGVDIENNIEESIHG